MIRGYFSGRIRRRPYVDAAFLFPDLNNFVLTTPAILDTGADVTTFASTSTTVRYWETILGSKLNNLPQGPTVRGPTGRRGTRSIQTVVTLGDFSTSITARIIEPEPDDPVVDLPPVLGWDILSNFTLLLDARTNRVLLLEPHEADALNLPS
jgi:hypothetical protein